MLILREKSPSDLHPNGHAFLTWRCHDFRTMASIYMSHLYTRSPRYIVAISKSEILFDLSQDDKATGRKFQKSNGINAGRCIQFGKIGSATFVGRNVNHPEVENIAPLFKQTNKIFIVCCYVKVFYLLY